VVNCLARFATLARQDKTLQFAFALTHIALGMSFCRRFSVSIFK
jgi:hypothetical protein